MRITSPGKAILPIRNQKTAIYKIISLGVWVAEINRYARIAPDFGSSSRRSKGSILSISAFWCNAKDGLKNKSAVVD